MIFDSLDSPLNINLARVLEASRPQISEGNRPFDNYDSEDDDENELPGSSKLSDESL